MKQQQNMKLSIWSRNLEEVIVTATPDLLCFELVSLNPVTPNLLYLGLVIFPDIPPYPVLIVHSGPSCVHLNPVLVL